MNREQLINDILDSYSNIFNDFVYENSENLDNYLNDLQTNIYKLKKIINKNDNKYYYGSLIMIHDSLDRINENNFTENTLLVIKKIILFYVQNIDMSKEKMFELDDLLMENNMN
jgi:predicted AlkP superfamily phosphohydrolase/phosphomutase